MKNKDKIQILKLFKSTNSIRETSRKTGWSRPTVRDVITKNGQIPIQRKFTVLISAFDGFDSPEKAYWLGFLLADGHIAYRSDHAKVRYPKYLSCRLQRRDKSHLLKLKDFLEYSGSVNDISRFDKRYDKINLQAELVVCSSYLCRYLLSCGWREFKNQGDISILNLVKDDLKIHLMRGLFDGDGGFIIGKTGQTQMYYVDMFRSVVEWFQSEMVKNFGFSKTKIFCNKKRKVCVIRYCGRIQVNKFLRKLYGFESVSLERKLFKASLLSIEPRDKSLSLEHKAKLSSKIKGTKYSAERSEKFKAFRFKKKMEHWNNPVCKHHGAMMENDYYMTKRGPACKKCDKIKKANTKIKNHVSDL